MTCETRAKTLTISRRSALGWLGAGASLPMLAACATEAQAKTYPISLSEDQWRKKLSAAQFRILREAATERAYTSKLNGEKRSGTYLCAGCDNALYASKTKYESGTGWPSFYIPLKNAVGVGTDYKLGYARSEVHCSDCGGHLGHVFDDGPKPTGKRYCMNGIAMKFSPA